MSHLNYLHLDAITLRCDFEFVHTTGGDSRAFDVDEKIVLNTILPTCIGASSFGFEVFRADENEPYLIIEGINLGRNKNKETFSCEFKLPRGLYFLRPFCFVFGQKILGRRCGEAFVFDASGDMLQLTVSDFLYDEPRKICGGIIYHIFVDRFRRGGTVSHKDYNVLVDGEWDVIPEYPAYPGAHLKNNTLYGGTLYGIIEKLEYISSLGCNAIYLSPIFESVSNHKYDTADYMKVDSCFGGDDALKLLIDEANKFGIAIILDGVFNHTGSDSRYFNRFERYDSVGAYQSKDSEFYEWFDFQDYPNKYTCWWDIEILPRINPDNFKCRQFFVGDGGVIDKYRKMGVYGFRLDVADELSDEFISSIKEKLSLSDKNLSKDCILYGEVWEDASNKIAYEKRKQYYLGSELDGVMNYPLRRGLLDYVLEKKVDNLCYYFQEVQKNTPERILHNQMNLLGTHDTERIITLLGGGSSAGVSNDVLSKIKMSEEEKLVAQKRLKSLYTVISTLPGIPTVFYGDEVGLEGYHDPFNRMPFPWGKENNDLLAHYRKIGNIRVKNDVYKKGSFKLLYLNADLLCFERVCDEIAYITIYNNGSEERTISFSEKFSSLLSSACGNVLNVLGGDADIVKLKKCGEMIFE